MMGQSDVSGQPREGQFLDVQPGSRLDYALRYARQKSWPVIPLHWISDGQCSCGNPGCKSPGKHPTTFRGVKDATTDEKLIREWFTRWPDANIGLATGKVSGLFAVDIDPRNGGDVTWQDIVDSYGEPDIGVEALTGGGGFHYLFSYPPGGMGSRKLPGGIDIKSDGGYIVVEPSNHASEISYCWEGSSDPLEGAELTSMPDWLPTVLGGSVSENTLPEPDLTQAVLQAEKVREIRSALTVIPADDRDVWLQIGMALHSTGAGQQAYGIWCEWAQNSLEKFDAADSARVWASFKQGQGITLNTLFKLAHNFGWIDLAPGTAAAVEAKPDEPLEFIIASQWYGQSVPERQWLWPDWIPIGQTTALYGDGGIGKTLLIQQLATCVASGSKFFDMQGIARGPVVGIFCEDDENELHIRQDSICKHYGVDYKSLSDLHLSSRVGHENLLMTFDGKDAGQLTTFWHQLYAAIGRIKPVMVIVDTAADTFGGNENIRPQVRQFIQGTLTRIAVDHNCAVVLCAHPSAAGLQSGSGSGGSTAWNNTVRSRLYIHRDEELGRTVLTRKKSNYAAAGEAVEMTWHEGAFISAANTAGPLGENMEAQLIEQDFLALLGIVTERQQNTSDSNNSSNYAPKVFARLGHQHRMRWNMRQFEGAMERLFIKKQIEVVKGYGNTRGRRIALTSEGGEK